MLRLDWNLLFTVINLLILYFLMKKFLFQPVNKILAKRQEMIEADLTSAKAKEEQALGLKKQYEDTVAGLKQETEKTITASKKEAIVQYDRIVQDAQQQAQKIVLEAKKNADLEHDRVLKKAEAEITGLVVSATAKLMEAGSNDQSNKALYDQFLGKAGDSIETGNC